MTMNSSGSIRLGGYVAGQSIALEVGRPPEGQISLNDTVVRGLAGVPTGQIQMPTNFWGKQALEIHLVSGTTYTSSVAPTAVYWWKIDGNGTPTLLGQTETQNLPFGFQMYASLDAEGISKSNVVGQAVNNVFLYNGAVQQFTIPSTHVVSGVTKTVISAKIELWGAGDATAGYTRFDNGVVGQEYFMTVGAAGGSRIAGATQMWWGGNYYGYQIGCAFVSTAQPYDGGLNYIGPADNSTLVAVAGGTTGASGYGGGLVGGNGSGYAGVSGGTQTGPGNMGDGRGGASWAGQGKLMGGDFHGANGCTLSSGAGGYYPGGPTNVDPCSGQAGGGGSGFIHAGTGETLSTQNAGYIAPPNFGQGSNALILVTFNYA